MMLCVNRLKWFACRLLVGLVLCLPGVVGAASIYPLASFYQVPAAMLTGGTGILPELCNPTGDGVTCHLVVDAGSGFAGGGGGSTTFPYGGSYGQTAAAASFLGVGGYDGAGHFQPWLVSGSGVGSVSVSGTVPVTGTFYQASQPVTLPTTQPIQVQNGANVVGVGSNGAMSVQGVSGGVAVPVTFPSAQPVVAYQNSSGAATPVACDSQAYASMTTASTSYLLVTGQTGKRIYVCSYANSSGSASALFTIRMQYGTTTTTPCDTGTTVVAMTYFYGGGQQAVGNGLGAVLSLPVGVNLCALTGATANPGTASSVSYAIF